MKLALFILIVAAVAFLGGQSRPDAWFQALARPSWAPPNWLFAPVWTLLYIGIATAGWLLWRSEEKTPSAPRLLWIAQLALNAAWTWIFFGRHAIGWALIDILLLLACILTFIPLAYRKSRPAALLFIPYAAWVTFASVLNGAYWVMNRG